MKSISGISNLISKHWIKAISVFLFIILLGSYINIFAQSNPFTPGETLDPNCLPGEENCIVSNINSTLTGKNLNITGITGSVSAPTNLTINQKYNGDNIGYFSNGDVHNWRIYSYKNTPSGRIYSSDYLTLATPTDTVLAPTNLIVTQTCDDQCNYYADGSLAQNWRIYSYKDTPTGRIYSSDYLTLPSNFTDDNSNNNYDVTLFWTPAVGADGYRILKYDNNYNNLNYDQGYDTTYTSIIDDGCGNLCYNNNGDQSKVNYRGLSDNNDQSSYYTFDVSWTPAVGADGYRILKYDDYYPMNYDQGYDVSDTTITDNNCYDNMCFQSDLVNIISSSPYLNSLSLNGFLSVSSSMKLGSNSYINFGDTALIQGYGIRDNLGTIQYKHNNGTWINLNSFALDTNNSLIVGGGANVLSSNFLGINAGYSAISANNSNFIGPYAGYRATGASNSNFFGNNAGSDATSAYNSNFFGYYAGSSAANAAYSNFFGSYAGSSATFASNSNFLGNFAGYSATSAYNSNFFGYNAGSSAANAAYSNFFGSYAGRSATFASNSNFFGVSAGQYATSANNSNFFGVSAGQYATSANNSNFFGSYAGSYSTNASNSNFFGSNAGSDATSASNSNFLGYAAGSQATNASTSNFLGYYAGSQATNASASNFFGQSAGEYATSASYSNFFGKKAGQFSTDASYSNFLGSFAGYSATSASYSNFLGYYAGSQATNASTSNFLGYYAGSQATNASASNFFGQSAGEYATSASYSNFLGYSAGSSATNASHSNFFGQQAGYYAVNASYSNLFGYRAGFEAETSIHIGSNNIIIGTNISLPNATANAINLGGVLFGTGTYSTTTGNPSIAAVTSGKIGIAKVTPSYTLDVGNSSVSGIVAQFTNSTGYCTINPTTTSLSCSSDISLKKNIYTLDNKQFILNTLPTVDNQSTLDKILTLTPVTYNWNTENDTDIKHIGFIAQDMEQVFPDLVTTDSTTNLKSISYGNLTPYLVKAIQEMSLKIVNLYSLDTISDNSLGSLIIKFLNEKFIAIKDLTTGILHINGDVCVDDVCVTKDQFKAMLINGGAGNNINQNTNTPVAPEVVDPIVTTPAIDPVVLPEQPVVESVSSSDNTQVTTPIPENTVSDSSN